MEKDKKTTKSVRLQSGKLFLVENSQKGQEEFYLARFLKSEEGQKWVERHGIDVNSKILSESPDFIFTTKSGNKIGLELTQFILKSTESKKKSHAENIQALHRVGVKVVEYFQQKHNIPLSLTLEYYDKRKDYSTRKEFLSYCYNPVTPILNINYNKLKELIIQQIESIGIPKWGVNKEWVSLGKYTFIVSFSRFYEPYTNVQVNSIGLYVENPYEQLQQEIDKKNNKYDLYCKQCVECHLLVINENSSTGNCVEFSTKTFEKEYKSAFPVLYLMDFGEFNCINVHYLN